jgi:hypothetical protein
MPNFDFAEELKFGLRCVAQAVYLDERYCGRSVGTNMEELKFLKIAMILLATMPHKLVKTLVSGSLPHAVVTLKDEELLAMYNVKDGSWSKRSDYHFAPGVYCKHLVNQKGLSPTPNEFRRVIACLRSYISGGSKTAKDVDNALGRNQSARQDVDKGAHFYLNGSKTRVTMTITFCQALENRLDKIPSEEQDDPLKIPLKYVGYSKHINKRQKGHEGGRSNWLMMLVQAALRVEDLPGYDMHIYPVCFLANPREAPISEVLISVVTNSFYDTGGGFGVYQSGIKVSSAWQDDSEAKKNWLSCEEFRFSCTPFMKRLDDEEEYLIKVRKAGGHNRPISLVQAAQDEEWAKACQRYKEEAESYKREKEVLAAMVQSLEETMKRGPVGPRAEYTRLTQMLAPLLEEVRRTMLMEPDPLLSGLGAGL